MDLLGSILNSMDKPPTASDKQKQQMKKQKQEFEKRQQHEKDKIRIFRLKVEKRIGEFVKNEAQTNIEFEPMEKIFRSIIHDVCEVAGLPTHSEGQDDRRHVVVFKKEHLPVQTKEVEKSEPSPPRRSSPLPEPTSNYRDKYAHLIASEDAMKAKSTMANHSYGIVPSKNKRDVRSIEQAMTDIRARKKLKVEQSQSVRETVEWKPLQESDDNNAI